ncbi:hypothetical protein OEA41_002603 [Lepraria neglecta]|uniref:Zf-C3HC-domain-containing protein n=1 Tax=Lepraria neglecta TaxID=209136 RepID=A0AAD9ZBV2_9LECA|nr:hypothetical protein OEA41_002603 [Lepraria neglecta]
MPTALSTTKRKFHKILDSISNASSTSLATNHSKHNASTTTLPASMDPPAKKPRIARPTSAVVPSTTRIAAVSRPSTGIAAVKQAAPLAPLNEERKAPNFAPWDRGQFLERLKTYRHVDKWMGKPELISEVQWAKRGWSCVGKERVGCVRGCSKEVVITLEKNRENKENEDERPSDEELDEEEWREKAQEELVEKYAEMIITSHEGGCLWRRRGCDGIQDIICGVARQTMLKTLADTIQRLPLAHRATAIDELRRRYESLLTMAPELPPDPSTPEGLDISNIHAQTSPLICSSPSDPPADGTQNTSSDPSKPPNNAASPPVNTSAMTLALFGWQAEEGHISGLVTCTACFRRLGLWLFKPSSSDTDSHSSMERLDVIGEHRDYCPWVNPLSQNGTDSRRSSLDGLAGWEVLMRAVNVSTLHRRGGSGDTTGATSKDLDDGASGVASVTSLAMTSRDRKDEEERDKERWAKLKRLKQVFHVKRGKGKENVGQAVGDAAG